MPSLAQRLADAANRLAAVTETPRLDAEILLAHALGISRAGLLARLTESLEVEGFDAMLERRLAFEPIAYILGEWEFYSLDFEVAPPVLVPRPETEHLVEVVLEEISDKSLRVLELCTGSGCVAVAIAGNAPHCRIVATDSNARALQVARRNAARHGVSGRVAFVCMDLYAGLGAESALFEAVCANPPYVEEGAWPELSPVIRRHEDPHALLAGKDGLAVIRRIIAGAGRVLAPGGLLAFEIGMGQYDRVSSLLGEGGYEDVRCRRDLSGVKRIAVARRRKV